MWEDDAEFDTETEFLLARVMVEAQSLSKAELVEALVGAVAQKYSVIEMYTNLLADHGIGFRMQETMPFDLTDEGALASLFGYTPTDAEVEEFANDVMEVATMELDMDAIVLAPDE